MEINTELSYKLYEFLLDNPDLHDQRVYTSTDGKAHCIAGWIAEWDGVLSDNGIDVNIAGMESVFEYSRDRLGLDHENARMLFLYTTKEQALYALHDMTLGLLPDWVELGVI